MYKSWGNRQMDLALKMSRIHRNAYLGLIGYSGSLVAPYQIEDFLSIYVKNEMRMLIVITINQ